jgi:hypothetical protein
MTDDNILGYLLTDSEFIALTAEQWTTLRADFGLIRGSEGNYYYTIRDNNKGIMRVR